MGTLVRGIIVRACSTLHRMKNTPIQELGTRIRSRRKELGWTQEELAAIAGIDRSYIGGVERGERNLTFTVLCEICTALKCDVATITHGLPKAWA